MDNVIQFPAAAKEEPRTPEEKQWRRVWLKIFAAERMLRQFPLSLRCSIFVDTCEEHEDASILALVEESMRAKEIVLKESEGKRS